jgi:hypothetical protein
MFGKQLAFRFHRRSVVIDTPNAFEASPLLTNLSVSESIDKIRLGFKKLFNPLHSTGERGGSIPPLSPDFRPIIPRWIPIVSGKAKGALF